MRRFAPLVSCCSAFAHRLAIALILASGVALTTIQAQIPGRNVNMVSGTDWPNGDPYLQRQNEPSIAASTRNPLHLLGGSNDYRTVDVPGLPNGEETGDAWLGLFKSLDGGQRWTSTLLPGYPQDQSTLGLASPLKGYQAGADAVVRAGTSGLFFYSGLAFDRGDNAKSGIFVSRFIDNNNREGGDPVAYLGTTMVASSNGANGRFLDKPWMAVDIPRGNNPAMCVVTTPPQPPPPPPVRPWWWYLFNRQRPRRPPSAPAVQRVPGGNIYVVYSSITGDGPTLRSEIYLTMSENCGTSWTAPTRVSRTEDAINQGATLAIDPRNGTVYVAYRRFGLNGPPDSDSIMVARMVYGARRFDPPGWARRFPPGRRAFSRLVRLFEHRKRTLTEAADVSEFDQGTSTVSFRSNAYPTMTVDHTGRLYVAWSERGLAQLRPGATDGDARIVITTSTNGTTFTSPPRVVDDTAQLGHQLMPTIAFAGGKLMLVYYDVRETRAQVYGPFISDQGLQIRQTMDIRSSMGTPGVTPAFAPSVKVSDYLMGFRSGSGQIEQLQQNPPNLPMFAKGTVPFVGDYIDVTPAPMFVPLSNGRWTYNTATTQTPPVFHAVWTDNRDVRPPLDRNWANYTPPTSTALGPISRFDGTPTAVCQPGNAGSRNQNVYSARITGGLMVGSPGNAKPLSPTLQRGFVAFATNATSLTRIFRMRILNQPAGGRASFAQFPLPPYTPASLPPLTFVDVTVPPKSTASRTVYVTSSNPDAQVSVDISEIAAVGAGGTVPGGLNGRVVLNPDIENPDIENPDIENPDIENPDIENAEVYNPDIENPDIENPDIENPDIENPDIENPDIENVNVANPDIENVNIGNPDIENPDIENPDIENPDIENPDIENTALTDITWKVSNTGNTTAAFNVNLFLSQATVPNGVQTQLILHKTYTTPVTVPNGCVLKFESRNVLVANVPNPMLITPADGGVPDQNDPSGKNATIWLGPGEEGKITLRIKDNDLSNNILITNAQGEEVFVDPAFDPNQTTVTPGVASQGVSTEALEDGDLEPPIVTPTGANLFFLQGPANAVAGQSIAPPVRVQVRDNTSALLPGVTVSLAFGANPGGATLSGNTAVTGVDGIASFPALQISGNGVGYTLVATVVGGGAIGSGVSAPFTVAPQTQVTTTADSGPGSLRAAITNANIEPGSQTITFNIPGASPAAPAVIAVQTPLPAITSSMIIDGRTQPGYDNRPVVELTWLGSGPSANGFTIGFDQTNVQIFGLAITGFPGFGIQSLQADSPGGGGHQIRFNTIGTDRFSTAGKGNQTGIEMRTDDGVIDSNVISGNASVGVLVTNDADRVVITGNRIGTAFDGLSALPNDSGIVMYDSLNDVDIVANLIAGNAEYGIDIQNSVAGDVTGTKIRGNRIGLSDNGAMLPNGDGGIKINSAPATVIGAQIGGGNIISGNGGPGIWILGTQTPKPTIQYNTIGLDPTGLLARPNSPEGIFLEAPALVGGTVGGEGNFIAGNGAGNTLGGGTGIDIVAGAEGTEVYGNTIGLNIANVATGNGYSGITVYGGVSNVTIGSLSGVGNVISGNPHSGVAIYRVGEGSLPSNISIQSNLIGTDPTGLLPRPNGQWGVSVLGTNITIGGSSAGANLIMNNGTVGGNDQGGIGVEGGSSGVAIQTNRIHNNGGLGIDLDKDGVTTNDEGDGDAGPNSLENYPVLSGATNTAGGPSATRVNFAMDSVVTDGGYVLRFYANPTCDPSGNGEGDRPVGVTTVAGNASGSIFLTELVPPGQWITAHSTSVETGETSEFSPCAVVPSTAPVISATSPSQIAAGFGQMITIRGANLPGTGAGDVLFSQGGTELQPQFVWSADAGLVIARLPLAGLIAGPATVRIKNAANTVSTAPFSFTVSNTPGILLLKAMSRSCSGGGTEDPLEGVFPGQVIGILAEGIDTSGAEFRLSHESPNGFGGWVQAEPVQVAQTCTTGVVGGVSTDLTIPTSPSSGRWIIQIRTTVNGIPSNWSNATVQMLLAL